MEDVEVCKEFTAQGIVSRINFLSSAKTIGIDEKYTSTFQKFQGNWKNDKSCCDGFTRRS